MLRRPPTYLASQPCYKLLLGVRQIEMAICRLEVIGGTPS